ncbi:MAG: Helix-turn-helix domain [Firmicutes bacterium]|nr:Helix-turn-helix domain [Bacillota bacterium]
MTNADIGKNIKAARIQQGLSQEFICTVLGKSKGWLSRRENGQTNISAYDFCLITTVLNEPIDAFF